MAHETPPPIPPFVSHLNTRLPCTSQPSLFHPPDDGYNDHGSRGRLRAADAVSLCRRCPVMLACRQWARKHREFGVWGGETDEQRLRATDHAPQVRRARTRSRDAAALDAAAATVRPDAPPQPQPGSSRIPRLTPVEEQVLAALCEGIGAGHLHEALEHNHSVVTRALTGLQRKLQTRVDGLVDAAREAGVLPAPYVPAA
ncbi:WhiB family transcriptional regulator [Streptomyces sp. NPDC057271]|uniref:WhiB family transcriptional regulator n=1 Tax=unclassified Streptomyces TaxID=2593676 RepID=UPI003638575B